MKPPFVIDGRNRQKTTQRVNSSQASKVIQYLGSDDWGIFLYLNHFLLIVLLDLT